MLILLKKVLPPLEREKIKLIISELHSKGLYFDEQRRELQDLSYEELKTLLAKVRIAEY